MSKRVERRTVDLSGYPDLVVIYLGMRVNRLTGLKTLFGFGPKISNSVAQKPEGLLLHENLIFSLFPLHAGMRQYWKDFATLEAWTRSDPHREWWRNFLRDSGGTGFWHETYFIRGGFEAIYDDVSKPLGFLSFAPSEVATGSMFSARHRLGVAGTAAAPPPVSEADLTGKATH
jgi:Monooxygenase af470-like